MTDESLDQFLPRRLREVRAQKAALKSELSKRDVEEETILETMHKLGLTSDTPTDTLQGTSQPFPHFNMNYDSSEVAPMMAERHRRNIAAALSTTQSTMPFPSKYEAMTIKNLAIQALIDKFPNGASLTEIRDFIRDAYGRVIPPSSLRPQMHRLKAAEILGHDPSTDTWNFRHGKRGLYQMYDHPTSRAAMKELQDDEIPPNEPRTRLRDIE